ncbi:hypothetical protein RZS08_34725, partial [Arthrospira platensis SPKY1]|nr:hypothetical protein [Arthrospira platensis SPKY1]
PIEANIAKNFSLTSSNASFEFGDSAPTESAWRKSSEFPFALLAAWSLIQPAKLFGIGFDISRISRDLTGNLVYIETDKRINLKDLVFPCVCVSDEYKQTSGLVNYI